MKKVLKWMKGHIALFILSIMLTVVGPLTYSFVPQFIKYVIDILAGSNSEVTLPSFLVKWYQSYDSIINIVIAVGITLVIFQTVRALIMVANAIIRGLMGEKIALNIRQSLFDHINELSYFEQNHIDSGDLIQRCTSDVDTVKGFLSASLPSLVYVIGSMGAGIYQMASINVWVMLVTLIIVPFSFISCYIYFKHQNKLFEEVEELESDMTSILEENVNGVRVVKAFNQERREILKFNKSCDEYASKYFKFEKNMATFWGFSDGLTTLQYGLTTIVCVIMSMKGLVSAGDIVACFMYIAMLVYPVRNLGRVLAEAGKASVAAKRIEEVLAKPSEFEINGTLKPEIKGNIVFDHVNFRFEDATKDFLTDVSFEINEGETVAIVGKTGSGKSTIALLLERMLEYNSGSIKVNGVELKDIEKKHLRENVGIVLQDPFLYAKTIIDNIRIANMDLSDDKVYKAAQIASIDNEISSFDMGYSTLVGEKGVTLSGGQKQRVAIARMLILNKPIVIFDDSLSAVDTETDAKIRKALKSEDGTLTSIIITHRITTAKEANKIIVIENGTISDIGTHEELINREGLYKTLWGIQGALEGEFTKLVSQETK